MLWNALAQNVNTLHHIHAHFMDTSGPTSVVAEPV